MTKKAIRTLAIALIVTLLLGSVSFAAQESSTYISSTSAYFIRSGNDVNLYFTIVGRGIMNEIGVSEIYLYEKTGNTWHLAFVFNSSDSDYTSAMLSYNTSAKSSHVTYSGSAYKDYYAILLFYAADAYGSDTIPYVT